MDRSLRFHPLTADDVKTATGWYDQISVDLGNKFRSALKSRFELIREQPELFGRVHSELRATRVRGFPYLVIYESMKSGVVVLGVFHASADPEGWKSRA